MISAFCGALLVDVKETLLDGNLRARFDANPDLVQELSEAGKTALSLSAAADFTEKLVADIGGPKADEFASIVLSAAHKFTKPIAASSVKGREACGAALDCYTPKHKEKVTQALGTYATTRLTEVRGTLASLTQELGALAGGSSSGAVWTDGFDNRSQSIVDHFRDTLDKADTRAMEKLLVKMDKAHFVFLG